MSRLAASNLQQCQCFFSRGISELRGKEDQPGSPATVPPMCSSVSRKSVERCSSLSSIRSLQSASPPRPAALEIFYIDPYTITITYIRYLHLHLQTTTHQSQTPVSWSARHAPAAFHAPPPTDVIASSSAIAAAAALGKLPRYHPNPTSPKPIARQPDVDPPAIPLLHTAPRPLPTPPRP